LVSKSLRRLRSLFPALGRSLLVTGERDAIPHLPQETEDITGEMMTGQEMTIEIAEEGAQGNGKSDPGHGIGTIEEGTHDRLLGPLEIPQGLRGGAKTQDLTLERGKEPCLSSLEKSTRGEL
jgi:hypothetical protein